MIRWCDDSESGGDDSEGGGDDSEGGDDTVRVLMKGYNYLLLTLKFF